MPVKTIVRRFVLRLVVTGLLSAVTLGLSGFTAPAHAGIPGKCVDWHEPALGDTTVCTP
jgi:hypothetical protein